MVRVRLFAGHAEQLPLPEESLNVSTAHGMHAAPSMPLKPAKQTHCETEVEADPDVVVLLGQLAQFARPVVAAYVPTEHWEHGPPASPANPTPQMHWLLELDAVLVVMVLLGHGVQLALLGDAA